MPDKPRVFFLANTARFDTSDAESHGEIQYLLRDGEITALNTDDLAATVVQRLEEASFDVNVDLIALTGQVTPMAVLLAVMGSLFSGGILRLLLFVPRTGTYMVRRLALPKAVTAP